MTGIYVHIPFCKSRCVYCGFYSTTVLALRQSYVDAVCREAAMRPSPTPVATIYLGGGTPSQLSPAQLQQLFEALYKYNKVESGAEVTIECNPDDVTPAFAKSLRSLPVNRVSMGAQTFSDARLRFLRRRHSAAQVAGAVDLLRKAGISNVSIDLMYGFPSESLSDWQTDIDSALALGADHLSAYCLMIEEGTPLAKMPLQPVDEELERQMYYLLIDRLTAAGYEHYELSNFARPGYRSRHNSSYWNGTPYIGLGAAAHSYDGLQRSWNDSDIRQYIDALQQGRRPFESETIDADTRYNDLITVALRTREGLDLAQLPDEYRDYCLRQARRFIAGGLLQSVSDRLSLTRQGLFVSDMVQADLIKV